MVDSYSSIASSSLVANPLMSLPNLVCHVNARIDGSTDTSPRARPGWSIVLLGRTTALDAQRPRSNPPSSHYADRRDEDNSSSPTNLACQPERSA